VPALALFFDNYFRPGLTYLYGLGYVKAPTCDYTQVVYTPTIYRPRSIQFALFQAVDNLIKNPAFSVGVQLIGSKFVPDLEKSSA
jgi:hypothetical protein